MLGVIAVLVAAVAACTPSEDAGRSASDPTAAARGEAVHTPDASPRRPLDTRRPEVGDCWDPGGDGAMVDESWVWRGPPPVDCTEPHTAVTVAVVALDDTFWRKEPLDGAERFGAEESGAVAWACGTSIGTETSGEEYGTRVQWRAYLPSWERWQAGERWLRCDAVLRGYGPVAGTGLEALPASRTQLLAGVFTDYLACYSAPPDDAGVGVGEVATAWFVPCDGTDQWRYGIAIRYDAVEYPGGDELVGAVDPMCGNLAAATAGRTGWVVSWPSEEAWVAGSRAVLCWLT